MSVSGIFSRNACQIASGVVLGNEFEKAFFSLNYMSLGRLFWMALTADELLAKMKTSVLRSAPPQVHTALRVGAAAVLVLNGINWYMCENINPRKGWFEKISAYTWVYSHRVTVIFSIFQSCATAPTKAVTVLASVIVVVLDQQKKLDDKISRFWKHTSDNSYLAWGIWLADLFAPPASSGHHRFWLRFIG